MSESETVVVLGASPKTDRFSNRAVRLLLDHGHDVIPIHPVAEEIHGAEVNPSLEDLSQPVDTLTLYLAPSRSLPLAEAIVHLHPRRVIFNPGTESPELQLILEQNGISVQTECTLVLLNSGQY